MTSKARQLGWWRRAPGLRSGWPGSWPHPPPRPPLPVLLTLDGGDVFYGRQLLRPFLKSACMMWGGEGLLWPLGESPPLTLPGAQGPHFLFLKQPRQAAPPPRPQPPAPSCTPPPRGSSLGSGAPISASAPCCPLCTLLAHQKADRGWKSNSPPTPDVGTEPHPARHTPLLSTPTGPGRAPLPHGLPVPTLARGAASRRLTPPGPCAALSQRVVCPAAALGVRQGQCRERQPLAVTWPDPVWGTPPELAVPGWAGVGRSQWNLPLWAEAAGLLPASVSQRSLCPEWIRGPAPHP